MDEDIIRGLLKSSAKYMKTINNDTEELEKVVKSIPVLNENTLKGLSTSLADLIAFKVSPDAKQRYSVRIQVIEILRELIKPPVGLADHQTFCQSDNVTKLTGSNLRKFLNDDFIKHIDSPKKLITLGHELINLTKLNPNYKCYLRKFIDKTFEFEIAARHYEFVDFLLNNTEEFHLKFCDIENLVIMQKEILIETPIVNCLIDNLNNKKLNEEDSNVVTNLSIDKLIQNTCKSPKIFQIICNILGTLFKRSNYSQLLLNYIKFILMKIETICNEEKKLIINLYPLKLQSYIILLKIQPNYHSEQSKFFLLNILKDIYTSNPNELLILLTHFPLWLDVLSNDINSSKI